MSHRASAFSPGAAAGGLLRGLHGAEPALHRASAIHWTPRLAVALAVAAVLATAAAFSIQSWAQSVLPPTHMALVLTMEPVFAWITSFLVTGERLGMRPASGALLILAGIALTELVPMPMCPRRMKHENQGIGNGSLPSRAE